MKYLSLALFGLLAFANSYACDDIKTTQAIVEYVCDYSLVSNTQCKVWSQDVQEMKTNQRIIADSFIAWKNDFNQMDKMLTGSQVN